MSDSNEFHVDPQLDRLLSRTLGRGSVPREQRQRHLERLGLKPRLGGSAGRWRAPVVAGRPPSAPTPRSDSLPARRRRRQWLELGAAVLAVVLVASLLVALFRDWGGSEDDLQLAASPEATSPAATAVPRETRERIYVVSQPVSIEGQSIQTTGRVSALDPQTGEEFWAVEANPRIDSVLSPDGRRLFVADSGPDGDHLYALDTQTGRELWRQPVENRQWLKQGGSYSTLSVSPDGSTVSVYACEGCTGEIRSTDGRNWLAGFDAVTGGPLPDIEIPACRGQTFLAPEGTGIRALYVICDRTRRLEIVQPDTDEWLELTYDTFLEGGFPETTGINAAAASPDGRWLYIATGNRLTAIDMTRRAAKRTQLDASINVAQRMPFLTLSPDGGRLYIGSLDAAAYASGSAEVNRVDVYDTASWEHLGQVAIGSPLTHANIATTPDDDAIYGVFAYHPKTDDSVIIESTIMRLGLDAEPSTVATRTNEEVMYLFAGRVEVDPDAVPRPTPTPEPTAYERLFAVSHILSAGGDIVSGRITAYDAETGEIDYWLDTGASPDAVLSPDGTRLFIASSGIINSGGTSEMQLQAVESVSGDAVWDVVIENRIMWQFGDGPTTMAVSHDNRRLFIYSASAPGDYTIQVFDTTDGALVAEIDGVAGCTAQLFPSADGRSLYVVCLTERFAPQVIDLETMTSAGVMQGFGGVITGAAASPDGRWLYIPHDIDTELRLTVIDMNARTIATQRDIVHMASDPLHSLNTSAVSPDGSRLFIGLGREPEGEAPVAERVWVWDTANLHNEPQKVVAPEPITGWSIASDPDNHSVFAICADAICRLSIDDPTTPSEIYVPRDNEVLRLLSGRVSNTPTLPGFEPEPVPSTPPDIASVCPVTPWTNLDGRDANLLPEAYWIEGDGLALGHRDGRLVEGQNTLAWVVDSPGIVDPDTSARVAMRGTRLQTGYEGSVPLELREYAIEYNAVIAGGVEHHIDSTFVFPTYGCWHIEAEFGDTWLRAIVHVEPDATARNPARIWDVMRWRPLHDLGIDVSPPCVRNAPQQLVSDFGPVLGDMNANAGPVYMNGVSADGAMSIPEVPAEDGGYYTRVMFVTDGSYSGPLLVRAAAGSGPIAFTLAVPDTSPANEWHLQEPSGTSPTQGVRHWIVYLRFDGPGCHALQIDGLDFTSIIAFEVLVDAGS